MGEWRNDIRAFLKSKWAKPVICLVLFGVFVGLGYQLLIALPDRRAERERQMENEAKQWLLLREPVPQEDETIQERHRAWDEIERKRIDPDYQIPQGKLDLIKKHWAELTSGWTPEQVERLSKKLGLDKEAGATEKRPGTRE